MDEKTFDDLWNTDDLARTEEDLRLLTLKVKATGNPYLLVQLQVRTARAQGLQRKFDEGIATLGEADFVLLEAAQRDPHEHPPKHRAWIRYMIERGRMFALTGWPDSAQNYLHDACHMARDLGYFDLFKEAMAVIKDLGLADPPRPEGAPSSSE
jgi:hypothetical protein